MKLGIKILEIGKLLANTNTNTKNIKRINFADDLYIFAEKSFFFIKAADVIANPEYNQLQSAALLPEKTINLGEKIIKLAEYIQKIES